MTGILLSLKGGVINPMLNSWPGVCDAIDGVIEVAVEGVTAGDDAGAILVRSRLARLRTLTRRGRSLDDWKTGNALDEYWQRCREMQCYTREYKWKEHADLTLR